MVRVWVRRGMVYLWMRLGLGKGWSWGWKRAEKEAMTGEDEGEAPLGFLLKSIIIFPFRFVW